MEKSLSQNLQRALAKIDRPGSFCVQGSVPAILPGLEVRKVGPIGLPLTIKQAEELKAQCEQAPYGKGTKTLVDTEVRRVWRLEPNRFALKNPDWETFVKDIVGKVQKELGLESQKLEAHLYDLLLYEPGSFFLPHQDGEKLDRMVATLVIVLPSPHHGGALLIRHEGQEEIIDFGSASSNPFQIHFAAFYADCEHEVRPLRDGYRLCLVYNLTLAKGKSGIKAPRASVHVEEVAGLLAQWAADPSARKLAITLTHEYTETSLAWDALKGVDRAVATILDAAACRARCKAYLALLTLWESGSAEPGDYEYGYSRGGRWHDAVSEEDDGAAEHTMGEVIESSLTAKNLKDLRGEGIPIEELSIDEEDLLDPEMLREVDPEEDFEGYTGNAGMTLDLWYRHAAIILWPEKRNYTILSDESAIGTIPLLEKMVGQWRQASKRTAPALKTNCTELAAAILASWRENPHGRDYTGKSKSDQLFELLVTLDNPKLIEIYLNDLMVKDTTLDPGKALGSLGLKHGWQTFEPRLTLLFKQTSAASMPRNIRVLEHIGSARPAKDDGWYVLCEGLAGDLIAALERIDLEKKPDWQRPYLDRKAILPGLVRALVVSKQPALLARFVAFTLKQPDKYPLDEVHLTALAGLQAWLKKNVKEPNAGLAQWLTACRIQLESLTAAEPRPPADFRRPESAVCRCELCRDLNRFLADPAVNVHRFSVRQDLRNHLENEIRNQKCDVDCKTERTRSPHTLVCTKNTKSYEAALKKYHVDQKQLAMVRAIESELP